MSNYTIQEGSKSLDITFTNIRKNINIDFQALLAVLCKSVRDQRVELVLDGDISVVYDNKGVEPKLRISQFVAQKHKFDMKQMGDLVMYGRGLYHTPPASALKYFRSVGRTPPRKIQFMNNTMFRIELDHSDDKIYMHFDKNIRSAFFYLKNIDLEALSKILTKSVKPVDDVWHYFRFISKPDFDKLQNRFIEEDLSNFTHDTCFKPIIYREDGEIMVEPLSEVWTGDPECPYDWYKIDYIKYLNKHNSNYTGKELRALATMTADDVRKLFVEEYKEKLLPLVTCLSADDRNLCANPLEMITQYEIADVDVNTLAFLFYDTRFWCLDRQMFDWVTISKLPVMREWIQNPLAGPMDAEGYGGMPNPKGKNIVALLMGHVSSMVILSSIPKTIRNSCPVFRLVKIDRFRVGNVKGNFGVGDLHGQNVNDIFRLQNMTLNELRHMSAHSK